LLLVPINADLTFTCGVQPQMNFQFVSQDLSEHFSRLFLEGYYHPGQKQEESKEE